MKGTIMQPCLFPKAHLIHRLWWSDVYVLFNKAQFHRQHGMSSITLKDDTVVGLPLQKVHSLVPCEDRLIAEDLKQWRSSMRWLAGKKYPVTALPKIDIACDMVSDGGSFVVAAEMSLRYAGHLLGIKTEITTDYMTETHPAGDPCGWVLDICEANKITEYFCGGTTSREYLDLERCKNQGVSVVFQDWLPPAEGNLSWLHYWFADRLDLLKETMK